MSKTMRTIRAGAVLAALSIPPAAVQACEVPDNLAARRRDVIQLTNERRRQAGLPAFWRDARLGRAAQTHACWMAKNRTLSHEGANGETVMSRVAAQGYPWAFVAENVASGQQGPRDVVAAWMASPPHRANIENSTSREIGIGLAQGNGRPYWVMVLAASR